MIDRHVLLAKHIRRSPDGSAYELVERTLEPAMFVLSLLFVPVLLGPMLADMSQASESAEMTRQRRLRSSWVGR